jgi:hypothetical protein
MDLQELECGSIDWIEMFEDKERLRVLVNAVMNLRVAKNEKNFMTS